MVPSIYSDRISRVPPYSFITIICLSYTGYHPLSLFFPEHSIKHILAFGLIRFRSPLLTESLRFLSSGNRCFSSPGLLLLRGIHLQCIGLPHSDIYGSIRVCQSRSFSQLTTSFFASESLGIRHTALNDFFLISFGYSSTYKCSVFSL